MLLTWYRELPLERVEVRALLLGVVMCAFVLLTWLVRKRAPEGETHYGRPTPTRASNAQGSLIVALIAFGAVLVLCLIGQTRSACSWYASRSA